MLTLVQDKDATKIVGIYSNTNKKKKRAVADVYFTHDIKATHKQNVAPAAGVLALHKKGLKKIFRVGVRTDHDNAGRGGGAGGQVALGVLEH